MNSKYILWSYIIIFIISIACNIKEIPKNKNKQKINNLEKELINEIKDSEIKNIFSEEELNQLSNSDLKTIRQQTKNENAIKLSTIIKNKPLSKKLILQKKIFEVSKENSFDFDNKKIEKFYNKISILNDNLITNTSLNKLLDEINNNSKHINKHKYELKKEKEEKKQENEKENKYLDEIFYRYDFGFRGDEPLYYLILNQAKKEKILGYIKDKNTFINWVKNKFFEITKSNIDTETREFFILKKFVKGYGMTDGGINIAFWRKILKNDLRLKFNEYLNKINN